MDNRTSLESNAASAPEATTLEAIEYERKMDKVSEEANEELFGEGALARAPFNMIFFLWKFALHVVILFSGPVGVLVMIATCTENLASLRYHRFIGCHRSSWMLTFMMPGSIFGLTWLAHRGLVLWLWPATLTIICLLGHLIVSFKYGSFTSTLVDRIRRGVHGDGSRVHAVNSWIRISLPLMRVELRTALRLESVNADETAHPIDVIPLRFIRVPPKLKSMTRDPTFSRDCQLKECSAKFIDDVCRNPQCNTSVNSGAEPSTVLMSWKSSDRAVLELPMKRVAELLLLATNDQAMSKSILFIQSTMSFAFAATPVVSTLSSWFHRNFPLTWSDWLVASVTLPAAFTVCITVCVVNGYIMAVALIDMRRRYATECSLLALMGPVLTDLPHDDSVVRQMRGSLFADAILDLQDSTTVYGIHMLRKVLRSFGTSWFQRCQMFLSLQFVVIILCGLTYLYVVFPGIHHSFIQVQINALLLLVFFSLPLLWTLINAINLGFQLNLLGEEYWPLALHTARLNAWSSASLSSAETAVVVDPGQREQAKAQLFAPDHAMELMARHVAAAQA